ncbi:MAG TPA: hypothetical protein VFV87_05795, partial [Pirellulaceae bacterium]|nr:hypothetical protein [Pirellulaceae bacterium]
NGIEVDQDRALGPDSKPDNWLVARLWFDKATNAVTFSGKPIRGKSPLLFYSGGPMSQINGAAAMQKDGYFFQRAQIHWQMAADEWFDYGNRELPATAGYNIRLNDMEAVQARVEELRGEVDKLAPGVRDQLRKDKIAKLTPELRAAYEKPEKERSPEEVGRFYQAQFQVIVADREVLDAAPREAKPQVRGLIDQIEADTGLAESISRNRNIVNFEYWRTRCQAERTDLAQGARKDVYDADKMFASGEKFDAARQTYERSWAAWDKVFAEHPVLMDNAEAQDLIESIEHYRDLLGQLDEKFPVDFPLNRLLERHQEGKQILEQAKLLSDGAGSKTPSDQKPASEKPASEKPADQKPADQKPADVQPTDPKSSA